GLCRSACLRRPVVAAVGGSENQASIADSGSGIGIGKRNVEKANCPRICLRRPRIATIGCPENRAFSADSACSSDRCSRIRIDKGNNEQCFRCLSSSEWYRLLPQLFRYLHR